MILNHFFIGWEICARNKFFINLGGAGIVFAKYIQTAKFKDFNYGIKYSRSKFNFNTNWHLF